MRNAVGPRRTVRLAAVAAAGLLAGLLPGTDSASGGQAGRLSLGYTCAFPGGSRAVTVEFEQTYPSGASAGLAFRPGQLTVRVPLPDGVLPAGTLAVSGTASLAARIGEGATTATTDWSGLGASATPVLGTGEDQLVFTGAVAPVTVVAPGTVSFAAGDLSLDLAMTGQPATGSPTADPSPAPSPSTTPPAPSPSATTPEATLTPHVAAEADRLAVSCALDAGQSGQLGTVEVAGASASPSDSMPSGTAAGSASARPSGSGSPGASGSPSAQSEPPAIQVQPAFRSGTDTCPAPPTGKLDKTRFPPVPPGSVVLPAPGSPENAPFPACAYADGFADVAKLGEATLVNDPANKPALVALNMNRRLVRNKDAKYVEVDNLGELHLPVARSTFLSYGFVPTSAEIEFTPLSLLTVVVTGNTVWKQPILTTAGGYQSMRIFDVKVNGTPLDVGPNCHTAEPINLVLHGRQDDYLPPGGDDGMIDYTIQGGGLLYQKDLYIPPFTGCGSNGEDLDSLFTAAVSGPGNQLNLIQGPLCTPTKTHPTCKPEIVIPDPPTRRH